MILQMLMGIVALFLQAAAAGAEFVLGAGLVAKRLLK